MSIKHSRLWCVQRSTLLSYLIPFAFLYTDSHLLTPWVSGGWKAGGLDQAHTNKCLVKISVHHQQRLLRWASRLKWPSVCKPLLCELAIWETLHILTIKEKDKNETQYCTNICGICICTLINWLTLQDYLQLCRHFTNIAPKWKQLSCILWMPLHQ